MKKWLCVWLGAAFCAVLCAAAAVFLHGWLLEMFIIAAAAVWVVFLARFCLLKYEISDSAIMISGGLFFKYSKKIERLSILSQSRLYVGRRLICTVIRTAGRAYVLFCSLPEN